MRHRKPRVAGRNLEYDEVAYREALRSLGLFAPVQLEEINRAYRTRAKQLHPDRFAANGGHEEATNRIQRLNAAHEYVVEFFPKFDKSQGRVARKYRGEGRPEGMSPFIEFFLFPVAAVYWLATVLAAYAGKFSTGVSGENEELDALEATLIDPEGGESEGRSVGEGWIVVGPHVVALLLFAAVEIANIGPPLFRWWFGVSLLVMLSTDIASRVTGESNPLRRHRTFVHASGLARGL